MNNEQIIKEFLAKIASQDNRCTAAPYFYVIRTKVEVPAHDGCGDEERFFDPQDPEVTFDSVEAYIEHEKEHLEYSEMIDCDKDDFDLRMENAGYNLDSYHISYDWKESGMFLTETDAKNHILWNKHHYSEDAETYVKHSWRAPELEKFFVAMFNHFKIEKGNLDLRGVDFDKKTKWYSFITCRNFFSLYGLSFWKSKRENGDCKKINYTPTRDSKVCK